MRAKVKLLPKVLETILDLKHRGIFNEKYTGADQNWELSSNGKGAKARCQGADSAPRVKTLPIPGHVIVPPCLPLCLSRRSIPCSACEQADQQAAAQTHKDSNCHVKDGFRHRDDHLQRNREAKRAKRRGADS